MAERMFADATVLIGTTDAPVNLSNHCRGVTINYAADQLDKTNCRSDYRERIPGFKNWSATLEFNQDYAAASVDATMFPLVGATTAIRLLIKPTSGDVGAANPRFYGYARVESYPPMGGRVGDMDVVSVTVVGTSALNRSVAAT